MSAPIQIGDILAAKYRVEWVLGKGGMGVVVAARHIQLGSLVALKFMLPTDRDARSAAGRFLREARAAACLRSDHIARVSDFGMLETGEPYIVMEFLEGKSLDAVQKARGPLPIHEVVFYMLDVCKGMEEAHALGIVHRDLKPQNLFLTPSFRWDAARQDTRFRHIQIHRAARRCRHFLDEHRNAARIARFHGTRANA